MLTKSPPLSETAPSSRWVLALTILLGQVTLAFSMFAVAVALPNIMSAMSADVTTIHWVMTGFQIARTVPMPALGWLSSLVGPRNLYIAGLFLTVLATICCGLAWDLESLIFFRVVQGLGAAPAQVTGMVILYEAFPAGQRGLVLGLILLAGSLGPTIGPSLGGYLVQEYSWRAMFYLSLPTAVLSFILTPLVLPRKAKPSRPAFDIWGLASMAIWVVALLLAISQGQREGWDSTYIRTLFALGGVFFVLFLLLELLGSHPFVELRLYRNPRFVIASLAAFLFDSAFNGANFVVALMLQQAFHFTPAQAGLILAPGAVAMGLVGLGAGRLADLFEPRLPIFLGLMLQTVAMYALGYTTVAHGTGWLTLLVIAYRASFGFVYTPLTSVILKTLPPERLSMGSGLDGIHRGFGSAFGIAMGSMFVERRTTAHLIALGEQHEAQSLSVQDAAGAVSEALTAAGEGSGRAAALVVLEEQLREEARIAAYQDTFLMLGMLTLLAVPPALMVRYRRSPASSTADPAPPR
ncbi:MAG: DHA2 family efflux MFS transporter permease subunit [Candidatus Tectimicrobiota bacterium]